MLLLTHDNVKIYLLYNCQCVSVNNNCIAIELYGFDSVQSLQEKLHLILETYLGPGIREQKVREEGEEKSINCQHLVERYLEELEKVCEKAPYFEIKSKKHGFKKVRLLEIDSYDDVSICFNCEERSLIPFMENVQWVTLVTRAISYWKLREILVQLCEVISKKGHVTENDIRMILEKVREGVLEWKEIGDTYVKTLLMILYKVLSHGKQN